MYLNTNGTLINENSAKSLKQAGLGRAYVSLDGPTAEVNDRIRGPGVFSKAVNGAKLLKAVGISTAFSFTVTKLNYQTLPQMIDFAIKQGFDLWVNKVVPIGKGDNPAIRLEKKQIMEVNSFLRFKRKELQEKFRIRFHLGFPEWCTAGRTSCAISCTGEVRPCVFHGYIAGSLRENNFQDIWANDPVFKSLRNPYSSRQLCESCANLLYCWGGCSAVSFYRFNNPFNYRNLCTSYKDLKYHVINAPMVYGKFTILLEERYMKNSFITEWEERLNEDFITIIVRFGRIRALNRYAKEIYSLCDGTLSANQICSLINLKYEIPKENTLSVIQLLYNDEFIRPVSKGNNEIYKGDSIA